MLLLLGSNCPVGILFFLQTDNIEGSTVLVNRPVGGTASLTDTYFHVWAKENMDSNLFQNDQITGNSLIGLEFCGSFKEDENILIEKLLLMILKQE